MARGKLKAVSHVKKYFLVGKFMMITYEFGVSCIVGAL